MNRVKHIKAGALSVTLVVSTLMLLGVLAVISLWDMDMLMFSRTQYIKSQRANIESAYLLYSTHPEIFVYGKNEYTLFEGQPSSEVTIERERWGLYELVSITGRDAAFNQTRIFGLCEPSKDGVCFYYPENYMSVSLSGNTNMLTKAYLPINGFIYGQMSSEFFSGKEVEPAQMIPAETALPQPMTEAFATIDSIRSLTPAHRLPSESFSVPFYRNDPVILSDSGNICNCELLGKIVVTGDNLSIDSSCRLNDIIIVCSTLTIKEGFEGSIQVFAKDSIILESDVRLLYPSGIYSQNMIRLSDHSEVSGYIIVNPLEEADVTKPHYVSTRKSLVRGFIYVNGNAHLQGIVSGSVFVKEAVYYTPHGYYRGMLHDFTLLENSEVAYPVWLDNGKRRVVKWVS